MQAVEWIDVHTHINFLKISEDGAITQAQSAGVQRFITIGTEPKDHPIVLDLARRRYPIVACTLGVHPHEAQAFDSVCEAWIRQNALSKEVVAIGEIGLDYYYNNAPREVQVAAFRAQMQMAADLGLPVEIHTRDAEADTAKILQEFNGKVKGLLHCFTSSMDLAKTGLNFGFDISISGVVTFKNADELRKVVEFVPMDRLHAETDAPFLSPVPQRGKPNVPAFVVHTAQFIAQLKQVSVENLSRQLKLNALRLFPKLSW